MMDRRRLLYNNSPLPSAYQEVAWIGATGSQYLIIDYRMNLNTMIEVEAYCRNDCSIYGTNGDLTHGITGGSATVKSMRFAGSYNTNVTEGFHKFSFGGVCAIDDIGKPLFYGGSLAIFGRNVGVYPNVSVNDTLVGEIKYFKVYEFPDGIVVNLVPCYRKSDGEIGMYDTIGGVFYTNRGTGTFSKGDNV